MRILAFETSAKAASAALLDEDTLLGQVYLHTGLTHSQTLLVMAQDLLKSCGLGPADVTHVAVAQGPGSFTGVRIGMAAAKGFAWGRELPCVGVSTLEAMAVHLSPWEGTVCCCMDARRQQVYNALFSFHAGQLTRLTQDRAISLEELSCHLAALSGPIFLVGDGSRLTYQALSSGLPALILPPEHQLHQRASGVALVARRQLLAGQAGDPGALVPNYLRLSQAERERLAREQG